VLANTSHSVIELAELAAYDLQLNHD
jgi:hypothetical protein